MPDITMCTGEKCPLKETCYRYLARPSIYNQSFFEKPPYDKETKNCNYYLKDKKKT